MKKYFGFTLVELLITVSIIAILASIGISVYSSLQKNARDGKRQSDLRSIQSALEQYYADQFYYPANLSFGNALSAGSKTYMNTVPDDPLPSSHYCYKPLKSTQTCSLGTSDCSNSSTSADRCVNYCLYAGLENQAAGSDSCSTTNNYNFKVTPP